MAAHARASLNESIIRQHRSSLKSDKEVGVKFACHVKSGGQGRRCLAICRQ